MWDSCFLFSLGSICICSMGDDLSVDGTAPSSWDLAQRRYDKVLIHSLLNVLEQLWAQIFIMLEVVVNCLLIILSWLHRIFRISFVRPYRRILVWWKRIDCLLINYPYNFIAFSHHNLVE